MKKHYAIIVVLTVLVGPAFGIFFFRGPLRNIKPLDWTPSRLAYINDYNDVNSVLLLSAWIAGTDNQIYRTDDGDGSLTLNLPQDINTVSSPTFVGLTLTGLSASRLIATSGADALSSINLVDWIAGDVNEITVTDDGVGGVVLGIDPNYSAAGAETDPCWAAWLAGLPDYDEFTEITTPATPDPNVIRVYAKDDGTGTSRFYILDDAGLETDLTGGGGGATTLAALLDVAFGLTPYTDGKVLRANGAEYVDAVLAHSDLSGIGTNIHTVIDSHLASTANPHSVTAAQAGAVALTGNETVAGIKTFSSFPLLPSSVPTTSYQAVHKSYVDGFAQSLEVKLACRLATTAAGTLATSFENGDTIDGVVLATGNRILIKDQADATTNGIYTVNASGAPTRGTDYDATSEVQEGTYAFITEGTVNGGYQFVQITKDPVLTTNDLVFTYLNKSSAYTGSLGVELVAADFRADLLATGAVGLTGNELKVNVDGSSIEIATNAVQVKALGVTNAMLAGSIGDNKLSTISTVDKVDWAAVNKAGSVLDDLGDVTAPTPSDNQTLTWDSATSKWVPQTPDAGATVSAAVMDVDVYSSGTVDATWTNMPAAVTELFGGAESRVKVDLTYGTYYRIVVLQTVAGYSTADLNLQYSTDNVTYQAADTGAAGELAVGAGIGVKVGTWAALVAGAQADVWLRIVGKQGDGKVDPRFRQIRTQFKMFSDSGAETDPCFAASPAAGITDANIIAWNAGGDMSDYVPYVGATENLNMGLFDINNIGGLYVDEIYSDGFAGNYGETLLIVAASGDAGDDPDGSNVDVTAGTGDGTGNGGEAYLEAGNSGATSGNGGAVSIYGGDAKGSSGTGGNINFRAGYAAGTDANGTYRFENPLTHATPKYGILNFGLITADKTFTFPNTSGTLALTGASGDMTKAVYDVASDGFVDGNNTAYAASWDGNINAPSMNAVYDKIQSIGAGAETDPCWALWLAVPPNVSVFTNDCSYLTAEVDPCLALLDINSTDVTNWGTAYGWGDHGAAGYLTLAIYDVAEDSFVDGNDTAYGASWDTNINAPSMNAIYDKIQTLGGGGDMTKVVYDVLNDGFVDGNDTTYAGSWNGNINAASMNAVYDKIQALSFLTSADIDTFAELDAIVADKALVNKADGAVWLGVHDFGGATSLEIPNGANPTVDATGEMAWETDDNDLHIYDSVRDVVVAGKTKSRSFVIKGITTSDDFVFWETPRAITITKIAAICSGGTNVIGQLQEYSGTATAPVDVDGADWTVTTTEYEDTSFTNPTIDAGDWIGFKTTSVSGTVNFFSLTMEYYEQ